MSESSPVVLQWQSVLAYEGDPPYHPPLAFPEYPFGGYVAPRNEAYRTVREALHRLGGDVRHYGEPAWNPLVGLVHPGDTVVIKPNLIAGFQEKNRKWQGLMTHGSVLRAVIDYVFIALNGRGRIIVADSPQEDSDISVVRKNLGIESIQDFYREFARFPLEFLDLRENYRLTSRGIYTETHQLPGDPKGTVQVNLGRQSYFSEVEPQGRMYYGAYYDTQETNFHHSGGRHEYLISRTALSADVFISLPKLKTHKKVGLTLNLKGLVGINGQKNWLPHYALGGPDQGGDQFDRVTPKTRLETSVITAVKKRLLQNAPLAQFLAKSLRRAGYRLLGNTDTVVRSGNWHGNDTCWRMALDLNRILLWYNADGSLRQAPRRYLSVVDGIVGMEGDGPVNGDERPAGLIAVGTDPVLVDCVCAAVMGLDYRKIPIVFRAFDPSPYRLTPYSSPMEALISSNDPAFHSQSFAALLRAPNLAFAPHFGWKGHIESVP